MIRLERIEALLAITAAILVFLGVFGLFRRRCVNRAFTLVAFAAYYLSPAIIAYTLGLIQSAPFCSSHFPIWAAYLVVVLGSADSYTAHSIEDIEQWKSFNVDSAAKCFMTSWMIASYATPSVPIFCTVFLFVILLVKADERARALMSASKSVMRKNYKSIADYVSTEHDLSGDCDPTEMRGYKYIVRGAEETKVRSPFSIRTYMGKAEERQVVKSLKRITVDEVWGCPGRLLKEGDLDGRLKDLCLSFSLFKFICLRYAGYSLPQKLTRIFRVIEVERIFLFDLFYTKYSVNLNPRRSVYKFIQLAIVVAAGLISLPLVPWPWARPYEHGSHHMRSSGAFITIFFMMSIFIIEFAQFGIMIFSEWAKVKYICKYMQCKWWQRNIFGEKLIEMMCRVQLLKPWGRQLRQYSLLESYSYSPCKCVYNRFTAAYLDPKRNGQKQIAPINLSKQVMEAIALSLRENCLDNSGERQASLTLNKESDEFSWARNLETTTHVIMVWHIATTFCEHKEPPSQEQRDYFDIATALSKYLAYLVAFAPRLLPDHPCRTESIFDQAVSEASNLFGGSSVSMGNRIEKLEKDIDDKTIIGQGAKLGREPKGAAHNKQIWKDLANFWTEMVLYVAPSNDAEAHAKYLATGGEFLTHVWVLVSQAGITRDPLGGDDPERS
ncbi:hypothetical protein EUGRSUZ_D00365 [Eucalyptus grandis]|uniref:DUF4220 domain-containing protein n=1 Tax=Eucalyptus grandis TaxID=71139 RepID=A0A059CDK3_EUCGR|nr:hypothetical protein EUGRSUZ_D00365 [Eucalyptus grandis]